MDKRGGKRVGAGRPATGRTTTKATIYIRDRELINNYAKSLDISVNELVNGEKMSKDNKKIIKTFI